MPCRVQGIFIESEVRRMRYTRPSFYDSFSCIGEACKHNCCIGWEIDVDDETAELYASVGGEFGKELSEKITNEGGRHFCLQPDGRCPFLNEHNLCRIILTLGEDALCDICALHPRFFNSFPGREEAGLGLCCEETVRLLLMSPDGFLPMEEREGEDEDTDPWVEHLAEIRSDLFAKLAVEEKPFSKRLSDCCKQMDIPALTFDLNEWIPFFRSLERMDPAWDLALEKLGSAAFPAHWEETIHDSRYGRILSYFLFRHFLTAKDSSQARSIFAFCALGTCLIAALDRADPLQSDEHVRLYSAEIEYSDENLERICAKLRERFAFESIL